MTRATPAYEVSRRDFVVVLASAGGGLLVGCRMGDRGGGARTGGAALESSAFAPNAYVRVGRDGRVTLVMRQIEMGQGTYTSIPMIMAEELEIGLDQVQVEHAPADDGVYANPALGFQVTGGSTSIRGAWLPMRQASATARTMLIAAAADTWGVEAASCLARQGAVLHPPSNRRLGYGELADKAAGMRLPKDVLLKDAADFTLIGTPAKRLDSRGKVDGSAVFGIDVRLPGMKIAAVAACPVFGGKLAAVDEAKARAIKGVHQVVRLDDAVAVVADHMWAAQQGLAALAIRWDEGPNAKVTTADVVQQLEEASQKEGAVGREEGDVAQVMASAARKVEAIYQLPFLAHATMEPVNCTVQVGPDGCDIWVGTQIAGRARAVAAKATGLPVEKVQVHNHLLGGGFGRRLEVDFIIQAARIGKQVQGPVKVVWSREEDIQHDMYRPYYYDRIAAGLNQDGMPVAWSHRVTGSSILNRWAPKSIAVIRALGWRNTWHTLRGVDLDAVDGAAEPPYAFPNILVDYVRQEPPGIPTAFWRGVGPTHNIFVVESFMDELAAAAGRDPVEYRRALLGASPRARAVLDLAAEHAGWGQPLPKGRARGVSLQYAFGSYVAQVAEVEVTSAGELRVPRVVCAVDCGQIINPDTVKAQMEGGIIYGLGAALWNEITLKGGRVQQSNFQDYRSMRIHEAPAIEVYLVKSSEAPGGVGEPGTSAIAPAVANAVYAATGKRIRQLPLQKALQAPA